MDTAEKLLRDFRINTNILSLLLERYHELCSFGDVHAQSYSDSAMRGDLHIRSPVEDFFSECEKFRFFIAEYEAKTMPVKKFLKDLARDKENGKIMLEIIRMHYWKGESIRCLTKKMKISEKTIFFQRRKILRQLSHYLTM